MNFRVGKSPSDQFALCNCLAVSPRDFKPTTKHVKVNRNFLFTLKPDPAMESGVIGFSQIQRNWIQVAIGEGIELEPFEPEASSLIAAIKLRVDSLRKGQQASFDYKKLVDHIAYTYAEQLFTVGQPFVVEFAGYNLLVKVEAVEHVDPRTVGGKEGDAKWGLLMKDAKVTAQLAEGSLITLEGDGSSSAPQQTLFQANFKIEDLGIGGLESEFIELFRSAFSSRLYPASIIKKLGIQPVRGVMLHGPPGTGKTLIARQLGKMLNCHPPKVVNGPEVLNKYVGQSEENVRALFAEAEAEYKARGDNSRLHLIIFDEIDALCRKRGSRPDSTGVGDGIVNTILAKMDGVDQLNNLLVIGMTNRLELLDEALLRPGRFEIHLKIDLPDEAGRLQILKIHTSSMRENSLMSPDVDLAEIARLARNFTGAELAGLIRLATSFALTRNVNFETMEKIGYDEAHVIVCRDDFRNALGKMKAAFGTDDDSLESCAPFGIMRWDSAIDRILLEGRKGMMKFAVDPNIRLRCILLLGDPGSGRTSLAVRLARDSGFPMVKLLGIQTLDLGEHTKAQKIADSFAEAYNSKQSVVILDDLENLFEWVPMGSCFSKSLLQCLYQALSKIPPPNHQLLIIATANDLNIMNEFGLSKYFSTVLHVPNLTEWSQLEHVILHEPHPFPDRAGLVRELRTVLEGRPFSIPIKQLLDLLYVNEPEDAIPTFIGHFAPFITK